MRLSRHNRYAEIKEHKCRRHCRKHGGNRNLSCALVFCFCHITTSDRYISKGLSSDIKIPAQTQNLYGAFLYYSIFFHPDFTVGFGISPNQLSLAGLWIAPITAGGELHPAPKITVHLPMIISLSKDMSIVKFKLLQKVL